MRGRPTKDPHTRPAINTLARAEEAKLALEQFKSPRDLNFNPDTPLVQGLSEFAGSRVDIFVNLAAPDAVFFAGRVITAFTNSRWKPKLWNAVGTIPVEGVAINLRHWDGVEQPESYKKLQAMEKRVVQLFVDAEVSVAKYGFSFVADPKYAFVGLGTLVSGPPLDPQDIAPIRIVIGIKP